MSNLLTKYFSKSDDVKFISIIFEVYREDIHFGNMHNRLIILNLRMHAGQMLNILLNGTPTVSSLILVK